MVGSRRGAQQRPPAQARSTAGRVRYAPTSGRAHPVVRARAARPQLRGEAVLLGLRGLVGVRRAAAEPVPGAVEHLVVARRGGAVGRQVLPARLALDDRPRDRPRAAGPVAGRGARLRGEQPRELALRAPARRAGVAQRGQTGRAGLRPAPRAATAARRSCAPGASRWLRTAAVCSRWRGSSAARMRSSWRASLRPRRTASTIIVSLCWTRRRNSMRSSTSAKPLASRTTVTTSGCVGGVALAQHGGERAAALGQPRPQPHEALARDPQLLLGPRQARLPGGEVALRLGQAPGHGVDRVRRRLLQAPQPRRRRGELALPTLLAVDVVAQRPGSCASARWVRPARREREQERDGERRRMACRELRRRMAAAAEDRGGRSQAGDAIGGYRLRPLARLRAGYERTPIPPVRAGSYRMAEARGGGQRRCSPA